MSIAATAAPAPRNAPAGFFLERVLTVHHWTDRLMGGKPLVRAYSMVSPPWVEHLEFLSIKVQHGPLTSRLQHIQPGDDVLIGRKPTGTLLTENLLPGRTLWLLATGTGLAPFMSLIREPEVYDRFERVVVA